MAEELFSRLGGAEAVSSIVDRMYDKVFADPDLAPFFENVEQKRLRRMQYEFIASALGGPVTYSGSELQSVHAGLDITPQQFATFVGYLADSMEEHGASQGDVDEMLGRIALYRDQIIGGPAEED